MAVRNDFFASSPPARSVFTTTACTRHGRHRLRSYWRTTGGYAYLWVEGNRTDGTDGTDRPQRGDNPSNLPRVRNPREVGGGRLKAMHGRGPRPEMGLPSVVRAVREGRRRRPLNPAEEAAPPGCEKPGRSSCERRAASRELGRATWFLFGSWLEARGSRLPCLAGRHAPPVRVRLGGGRRKDSQTSSGRPPHRFFDNSA